MQSNEKRNVFFLHSWKKKLNIKNTLNLNTTSLLIEHCLDDVKRPCQKLRREIIAD